MKRRSRRPYWATPGHQAFRSRLTRAPVPTAAWFNDVQAELVAKIEARGVTLATIHTLRDAIREATAKPLVPGGRVGSGLPQNPGPEGSPQAPGALAP